MNLIGLILILPLDWTNILKIILKPAERTLNTLLGITTTVDSARNQNAKDKEKRQYEKKNTKGKRKYRMLVPKGKHSQWDKTEFFFLLPLSSALQHTES